MMPRFQLPWLVYLIGILFSDFFLAFDASGQSPYSGLPFVKSYGTEAYHAGLQNYTIKQDRRGFLYVANNYGLLEYDGADWRTYGVKSGTKVRSVAIDARGRVYVGCQGDFGYFFPNKEGELIYTSLADSLQAPFRNFDETWSVYIDHDKVYFCTFTHIFVYQAHQLSVITAPNSLELSFLVQRQLLVNQRNIGICRLEGTHLKPMTGGAFYIGMEVSSILPLPNGELLICTRQQGIFRWTNGISESWNNHNQTLFREANINSVIRLRNGNYAIGTQNEGLLIVDRNGDMIAQLTRDRGLLNRTILSLYEDDLGHLWVGQNNSIAYVEWGSPFTFINEQSGLSGTGYAAYLDGSTLYVGTNTGLYKKTPSENYTLIANTKGQVYNIGKYDDQLLVSHQLGSYKIERDQALQISAEPGSWLFARLKDKPDQLLEGTYNGLQVYRRKNGLWQPVKKLSGFPESSRVMAEESDGSIWVTHGYKGAFRIYLSPAKDSIERVAFYGTEKGFPSNRQINVYKVQNELLFTSEAGVFRFNISADRFERDALFTRLMGGGVQLWFIHEDAIGNIYFIGKDHLGVLRKNSVGDYTLYENEFNKIRKHLNDDLESMTILSNNEVLFAAKEGFVHYNPSIPFNKKNTFHTFIRQVSLSRESAASLFNGNYFSADSVITQQRDDFRFELPFANNSLNFRFAAPSFEGDGDVVYQYYLENFERDWSAWDPRTQKEYTNLREKSYVFHVRAKNASGEISSEATFEFKVLPPWYRSQWAYAIYSLSVISLLALAFSLLDRKYQRAQERMAELQDRQISEKDAELATLEIKSQEEINRLQNEKLEAELNHMKNELATATMHLLNKNEFITGIKSEIGQIAKKGSPDEVRTELSKIVKEIEVNISDDADWEHFQFHFDRVHGDFSSRLKASFPSLSPQEIKLCAYLRMNLSSKEIAQLLNISVRGVEISRYRLRKKLQLERERNLQEFILSF